MNPTLRDIVKEELQKLLNARLIGLIYDDDVLMCDYYMDARILVCLKLFFCNEGFVSTIIDFQAGLIT